MIYGFQFAQRLYADGDDKGGMSTGMKIGAGVLAAGAAFHGARKGVFGSSLRQSAGNAWAKMGNAFGSQGMMKSGLNDVARGKAGISAWGSASKEQLAAFNKERVALNYGDAGSIGLIKGADGKAMYGKRTAENSVARKTATPAATPAATNAEVNASKEAAANAKEAAKGTAGNNAAGNNAAGNQDMTFQEWGDNRRSKGIKENNTWDDYKSYLNNRQTTVSNDDFVRFNAWSRESWLDNYWW